MELPPQTGAGATPQLYETRRKSACTEDGRVIEAELPRPLGAHTIMNECQVLSIELSTMLNFDFALI